jgi:hypothetical protein
MLAHLLRRYPVGTITERAGVPHDVDQAGWSVGFYPVDHRPDEYQPHSTAETFEQARVEFEEALQDYLPRCTEADFAENRWQPRLHRMEIPHARYRDGAPLTNDTIDAHIRQTHMDMA